MTVEFGCNMDKPDRNPIDQITESDQLYPAKHHNKQSNHDSILLLSRLLMKVLRFAWNLLMDNSESESPYILFLHEFGSIPIDHIPVLHDVQLDLKQENLTNWTNGILGRIQWVIGKVNNWDVFEGERLTWWKDWFHQRIHSHFDRCLVARINMLIHSYLCK